MVRFVDLCSGRQGYALESERQAAIRATPVKFENANVRARLTIFLRL
jgi:hypothetical protein